MPIFELEQKSLVPIRRQAISAGVYESEIEDLLWDNLEELTGENLFRVARQTILPGLGRPDVIALDSTGRVVIIEVKRDVDRGQLAQALEYAGWARKVGLDDLAQRYHGSADEFWDDWKEFTSTNNPLLIQRDPQLFLVARAFDPRTYQALEFLRQHELPVKLLKVAFYVDEHNRRFLNVEGEIEPEAPSVMVSTTDITTNVDGLAEYTDYREVTLSAVAKTLATPVALVWNRPRKGARYEATLLATGRIRLSDGREFPSPSGAAMAAAEVVSYDGWYAWRVGDSGPSLHELRRRLSEPTVGAEDPTLDAAPPSDR
jgi:hypothetical protein